MIIRDLLSVLPKYSDNSGYDVVINFRTRNRGSWLDWDGVRLGSIEEKNLCYIYPFKSFDELLSLEVESIKVGKCLVNGGFNESLQIYTTTMDYLIRNN